MKIVFQRLIRFLHKLVGIFPRRLPQGMAEQNALIDRLMALYDLPTKVRDDISFVVAGTILRFNENTVYKSDWYFVSVIRAVVAKQLAGAMFTEVKNRQKEKAAAEATTKPVANVQSV